MSVRQHSIFWLTALLLCGSLTGCITTNTPDHRPEELTGQIPDHWTTSLATIPDQAVSGWITDFEHEKTLHSLVAEAVHSNFDLQASVSRINQVAAQTIIARAIRLPQIDLQESATRSQSLRGAAFQTVTANNFGLNFNLSWEIDLWGRIANLKKSQLRQLDAAHADYQAARLSLAGMVIRTTLQLTEAKQQIAINNATLKSLQTNLDILDNKLELGDADDRTALDISLSRTEVARAKANISNQERLIDQLKRQLETLLGRYPEGKIKSLKSFPTIKQKIPAGLPSELLLRRPDILAAEAQIESRFQETTAARKALLPALRITGRLGTATTDEFGDLFDIQNMVWNIAQGLTQPIFQGGRIRAEITLAEAQQDEAILNYAETALNAFREVETALAAEALYQKQIDQLQIAVKESTRAEALSLSQYEKGIVDIITLLESQRRSFSSQSDLASAKLQKALNRIDLYLALGGDFDTPADWK